MDRYGLVGYPLGHSFSRGFFTDKFASEGIDAEYLNFEIASIEQLPDIVAAVPTLRGLNVTIPYKEKVIPFLDEVSHEAHEIGAVNVVKVTREGGETILTGYNSDVTGFANSIRPLLKPWHRRALILGTGGASKAVRYALEHRLGVETALVSRYQRPGTVTYDDLDATAVTDYPVIINCSPVGMYPHTDDCPRIPYQHLTNRNLLFDLVYNPDTTLFMRHGAEHGATVKNGLEMLVLQAVASWELWHS